MVCSLFQYISAGLSFAYNKYRLCWTLDYWSRDMLYFDFLQKGLAIVSPPHFVYDLSRKMFLMLCSIDWPNFIVLMLYFYFTFWNIGQYVYCTFLLTMLWRFKINLNFLIKPFLSNQAEWNKLLRWNKN